MKLIDKDASVAEIERLAEVGRTNANVFGDSRKEKAVWLQQADVCDRILSFINTLEVKEVDSEKEIDDYVNDHFSECEDGVLLSDAYSRELCLLDITSMARHFFELGLKVNNEKEK